MSSTEFRPPAPNETAWRLAGLHYYTGGFFYRQQFGRRVWKVSVDGGFDCPNRDGASGTDGCVFCDPNSFSPSRQIREKSIQEQIDEGIRRLRARHRVDHFIAYFQPATNTYGPVDRLEAAYRQAIDHPNVVGLAIGTRPDCVENEVLDLLADFSKQTWLSVEFGLQTIHDRTLRWMNRGHEYQAFLDAHARSRQRGLSIGAHVILGLPGESREDMRATALELARLRIDSVKIHNLHAVKNTPLAAMVAAGEVKFPGLDEYVDCVVDFLELLPPTCVVDRLSGDAPRQYLIGPAWCLDKSAVRQAIEAEFRRRNSWQGKRYNP